jgi:hypothetical protein
MGPYVHAAFRKACTFCHCSLEDLRTTQTEPKPKAVESNVWASCVSFPLVTEARDEMVGPECRRLETTTDDMISAVPGVTQQHAGLTVQ